jgi:hypothetical protein
MVRRECNTARLACLERWFAKSWHLPRQSDVSPRTVFPFRLVHGHIYTPKCHFRELLCRHWIVKLYFAGDKLERPLAVEQDVLRQVHRFRFKLPPLEQLCAVSETVGLLIWIGRIVQRTGLHTPALGFGLGNSLLNMNRCRFPDDPRSGQICVLGRMHLLSVEIELSFEPPELLPNKDGSEFSSWHFLAASRAVRRRREILRVVNELQRWRMCHAPSLRPALTRRQTRRKANYAVSP